MRNEFIIQRALRDFKYDRSMTVAGGKLVEVGDWESGCSAKELESAVTRRTAGFHHMAHGTTGNWASPHAKMVELEEVIEIAHSHGLPVIVDAAFQCFPKDGCRQFIVMGADLVAYSCKYFGGPNTASILLGKRDLVETVALHSFVGQEGGPGGKFFLEAKPGLPHGSVFRGYKMDRSSILGAVTALEEHLGKDFDLVFEDARERVRYLTDAWRDIPGIDFLIYDVGEIPEEPGRVSLHLVLERSPEDLERVVKRLMAGNPPIWRSSQGNRLVINITSFRGIMLFDERDKEIVARRAPEELS